MRRFTLGLASLAALSLLSPGGASAQPHEITATASLVVPADPSGQRGAAAAAAVLKAAIRAAPSLRWIDPAEALEGTPATGSAPALVEARRALREGRQAYDALRLREATRQLQTAVDQLRGSGAPGRADLEEALSYLGAAQVLSGEPAAGERSFQALLSLNADAQLTDAPPAVAQSFQRAIEAQESATPAQLQVYTTPAYAAVFIDGRFRGVSPVSLNLPPGEHELRLEKLGYLSEATPLPLRAGQQATSQLRMRSLARGPELRDLAARAAVSPAGPKMSGPLAGLRRALGAERTIFVTVSQSGEDVSFRGAVYEGDTRVAQEVAVLSSRSPAFFDALRAYAARLIQEGKEPSADTGAFGLAGAAPATQSTEQLDWGNPGPQRRSRTKQYLGWGLVGVGGAAVVNGVIFGVLTKNTHSDYEATPQGSSELERLRDKGKKQALVADISYITGAAALLGGAALLWWSGDDEEPEGFLDAGLQPLDGGAFVSLGGNF